MPTHHRSLYLVLLLSGLLALGFAFATPIGGAPDETAHLRYVEIVATEHRLPSLPMEVRRNSFNDPNYEAHQSPFYYVLAAPFFVAGKAMAGTEGAAQGCRILSILLGLAGTWLVWRLTREVAPSRPWLAHAAAAFAGLLPMRLGIMASVSNDAAAEAAGSLALLTMLLLARNGWSLRAGLLLGAAMGGALLCKQSHIMLLPPALLAVVIAARREGRFLPPHAVAGACTVFGMVLLLSGWWFARNHLLYGDPLGQKAFDWYFEDTPRWENFRDQQGWSFPRYLFGHVAPVTFASTWGAFGHLDPMKPFLFMGWYPREVAEGPLGGLLAGLQVLWKVDLYPPRSWLYPLLALASWISAAGLVRIWLQRRAGRREVDPGSLEERLTFQRLILAVHAVFVFAAFLRFNATYFQGQGRYLFPAIAALAIAAAAGWLTWWPPRREALASWLLTALMALLSLYALFGVVLPGFRRP